MITAAAGSSKARLPGIWRISSVYKHSRTLPLDLHFIDSLMLSVAGGHAFPELNFLAVAVPLNHTCFTV